MPTIFSQIIDGQIPAHFVWQDQTCVAFLVVDPLTDGHAVVVPRQEIDQWLDADADLLAHVARVAQIVGLAQRRAFGSVRAGLMVQGFEVPHLHLHVWPTNDIGDFDPARITHGQDQQVLAANAERLRTALREDGHGAHVPG